MRLLNTFDYRFRDFNDTRQTPPYAILSHCWSQDASSPEVNHASLVNKTYDPAGYGWHKIVRCCGLAQSRGLKWAWIDTCCIDKTSSAELSEAINSMYQWYGQAQECYVFLDDVLVSSMPETWGPDRSSERWRQALRAPDVARVEEFMASRWFKRGWTLQELLAPKSVMFYNSQTEFIGSRVDLSPYISTATQISEQILLSWRSVRAASIAQRMSWASRRTTTRVEDMAYSMLGLFDVNMPLLYGEGERAFLRLQQEIVRMSDDESIFAWGLHTQQHTYSGVFANSPHDFEDCQRVVRTRLPGQVPMRDVATPPYMYTNRGVAIYHHNQQPGFVGRILGYSASQQDSSVQVKLRLNCQESDQHMWSRTTSSDVYLLLKSEGYVSYRVGLLVTEYNRWDRWHAERGPPQLLYAAPTGQPADRRRAFERTFRDDESQSGGEEDWIADPEEAPDSSPRIPILISLANMTIGTLFFGAAASIIMWLPKSIILISALVVTAWRLAGDRVLILLLLAGLSYAYWDRAHDNLTGISEKLTR